MNETFRHIIGYAIGILLFALLIPFGLIALGIHDPIVRFPLPHHLIIRILIALPLLVPGVIFMIWSNISLFFTGKGGPTDGFNIAISPRTKNLVLSGPYKYCRNPMVFGAFCVYIAIGLFMLSITCLLIMLSFLLLIIYYLKYTEEKRLEKDFGDAYIRYKNDVPMIFPKIN